MGGESGTYEVLHLVVEDGMGGHWGGELLNCTRHLFAHSCHGDAAREASYSSNIAFSAPSDELAISVLYSLGKAKV